MTFSIAARCPETAMFGLAVSSSSPAVAARCAYARASVGAVASQNITDPSLGPKGLDLMGLGATAEETIATLKRSAPHSEYRQLTAIDAAGGTASHSGANTLGTHAVSYGVNCVAAGNLLANPEVPAAMTSAFEATAGHLGDQLVAAMLAGLAAGGEAGPVRSAGMLLVDDVPWPTTDLRVDWDEGDPIARLAQLWNLWKPQAEAYRLRALNPEAAPSYGVPGDQ